MHEERMKSAWLGMRLNASSCLVCLVSLFLGVLILALHDVASSGGGAVLGWKALFGAVRHLTIRDLASAWTLRDALLALAILGGTAILLKGSDRSVWALIYFGLQPVMFVQDLLPGVTLAWVLPLEIMDLDAEWFMERTPCVLSSLLWMTYSAGIVIQGVALRRRGRQIEAGSTVSGKGSTVSDLSV